MRAAALILGIIGGLAALAMGDALLVNGSSVAALGPRWGPGDDDLIRWAGLGIAWGGGGLLALFGFLGMLGGLLAMARPRAARRLMVLAGLIILVTDGGVAALLVLLEPGGQRLASIVAGPLSAPAVALLIGGILARPRRAASPEKQQPAS